MTESSPLVIECKTKEELIKSLYKIFRIGKIPFKWENHFLDNTIKDINNLREFKRMFILMRNTRGRTILEIYCDDEEDKKDEEGKIIGSSKVVYRMSNKFGARKIYEAKAIERLIDGTREEENINITITGSIEKSPAQRIPELTELMEEVDEGRLNGRRREAAHAQRERDREYQRARNRGRSESVESPLREENIIEPIIPSVSIISMEEQNATRTTEGLYRNIYGSDFNWEGTGGSGGAGG
jgi:hypothetical protein